MAEDQVKRIADFIAHGMAWAFIALLVMNFMGYNIVHEDDYYTPEYVEELIQENENRKYECNVLVAERDYAVASAYFLNALLEKRNGDEYLYDDYYYIESLDDFCSVYASESLSYELSDDYDHDFDTFETDYHFGDFEEMLHTVYESGQQHLNLEYLE